MNRKVAIPVFGLTLVFFFLNWVIVQFNVFGAPLTTWSSGFGILKGTQHSQGDPFAVVPLLASLAGIGLAFVNDRRGIAGATAAGVLGALSLIWIRIHTSMQLSSLQHTKLSADSGFADALAVGMAQNMQCSFTFIFYLTIILFIVAACINGYALLKQPSSVLINNGSRQAVANKFCTNCGKSNQVSERFCTGCGTKMA